MGEANGNISILNCINNGNVSGRTFAGGIIGYEESPVTVKNCIVAGKVSASYDTDNHEVHPLEGDYKIYSALDANRMCLSIAENPGVDGTNLELYEESFTITDVFTLIYDAEYDWYYIKSKNSDLYLAPDGSCQAEFVNVSQHTLNYHQLLANAAWKFELSSDGYFYIKNENRTYTPNSDTYYYLNVANGSTSNGANIIVFRYTGELNEKFKLVRVDGKAPGFQGRLRCHYRLYVFGFNLRTVLLR